ncbi:hypothetical protein [Granulicoccus phenolivorans]|uniref:hypothetical protein n=1 Tax=Granulicoccus phenolivorans TaxID=266854 RepID=UPI0004117270|nr:hypothetical protein [Granulicoccus phenolivorans]
MTVDSPGSAHDSAHPEQLPDTDHVDLDAIADADEDLPTPERAARVRRHLIGCPECAAIAAILAETCAAVAADPAPAMPDAVFERLSEVVRAESARRRSGLLSAEEQASRTQAAKRTALGSFGENPSYGRKSMRQFQPGTTER